ncbi:hypothetical protein AAVH_18577 [Aphelenchoides avenae]|nr:hypothetical protein AAVH_18577 [Aphelenchus avenae]
MAFKAHELLEHRMASKRDICKAMMRIDQERPVYRTFVICSKAEAMEYLATKANEAAKECEAKSEDVCDSMRAMDDLTRDELESMTRRALRLKDVITESQVAVLNALSVCDEAVAAEIEKCNRVVQESNGVRVDKDEGPTTAQHLPSTSADYAAPNYSSARRAALKRKMPTEEAGSSNDRA